MPGAEEAPPMCGDSDEPKMVGCLPWGFSVQGLYSYIYIHMCVCDILYNPFKYIIIKILVLKYGYKYLFEFNYVICTCNMV